MVGLELYSVVFAAFGNLLLGSLPFLKNTKSATNKLFALLTTSIAFYLITNYLSLHQSTLVETAFWVRTVMSIALFINLFFFLLASVYPDEKLNISVPVIWSIVIATIVISALAQTNLIFSTVEVSLQGISPKPGPLIPLFLLHTILGLGLGFYLLLKKYRKSIDRERSQLGVFFYGTILMFSLTLLSNLIAVLVFNYNNFVAFLPIYTLIFTGSVSYSMVKHGLFNLKVIASQILVGILWTVLFAKIIIASNFNEVLTESFVFMGVFISGILLIRSVKREVSEREKLEDLTTKLKVIDKQKDEFISMAAHELRTPMTAVKGYVSMILEGDTGDISPKARGYLVDVSDINDRSIRLVNNMLNVSRIEEGRMVYQSDKENLSDLVRSVFGQFMLETDRKGLKYTLDIPPRLKDNVFVDADKIREVVVNLISNAVKYTEKGVISVRLLKFGDDRVRFEVEDTGSGISEEEQSKLFQKFHRVETNVGKTTGSGLGLYISKLIIEKFNGNIGIISKLDQGSTFWFDLPLTS